MSKKNNKKRKSHATVIDYTIYLELLFVFDLEYTL